MNGDLKLDNILYDANKGLTVIDKAYQQNEVPRPLLAGLLCGGIVSCSINDMHVTWKEVSEKENNTGSGFFQNQLAMQGKVINEALSYKEHKSLETGLKLMQLFLGKDQVAHDGFALAMVGRIIANIALTSPPDVKEKVEANANKLEEECQKVHKEMFDSLAGIVRDEKLHDEQTLYELLVKYARKKNDQISSDDLGPSEEILNFYTEEGIDQETAKEYLKKIHKIKEQIDKMSTEYSPKKVWEKIEPFMPSAELKASETQETTETQKKLEMILCQVSKQRKVSV
jgi:hypothetical protein